jgi:type III pantothenate kinase
MLLCLDIGNTHILGGVFDENALVARFRYATHMVGTADQFGIFLIGILQANNITQGDISAIALSSVVPSVDYTVKHTCALYFKTNFFALQSGVKTGLNIKCKFPNEVGSDRIANAIGAVSAFPNKNIIIVDMGTATTICAITRQRDFLGGAFLPGLRLGMESLKDHTAKLMEVTIEMPTNYIGRTTKESIQAGLFYGHLGAIKEIIKGFRDQEFANEEITIIGTGGFSQLYKDHELFDIILPDLVLQGLSKAYEYSL